MFVLPFTDLSALSLKGQVINKQNRPIPGLTISIVNTTAGRSTPSITDAGGNFLISNIPLVNQKFYLEIYWGKDLIYRNLISIVKDTVMPVIKI
jgi:hypothetical protein